MFFKNIFIFFLQNPYAPRLTVQPPAGDSSLGIFSLMVDVEGFYGVKYPLGEL